MKLRILGSGTSTGVPEIGCTCAVCTSHDEHDRRLRASALLSTDTGERILIDCGPDFREQMMILGNVLFKIDGVLLTHEHYDHVGGLDDLRPFSRIGEIPVYADPLNAKHLRQRLPYCFVDSSYPGIPQISLCEVNPGVSFYIGKTKVMPIQVMHGKLPILGYRIGERFAYITDMLSMPEVSYQLLQGVEILVINALRHTPHPSHQTLQDALKASRRIGAKEVYFIHMSHQIGLHAEISRQLPPHYHFTYDTEEINF